MFERKSVVPKCPVDYKWVKVPRNLVPTKCKGILKDYFKIAFASAYKDGVVKYCGHTNDIKAKQWIGGVTGIKRLLERRSIDKALNAVCFLRDIGLVTMLFEYGGKITVDVPDIIIPQTCPAEERAKRYVDRYIYEHDGVTLKEISHLYEYAENHNGKCYVNDSSGFICIPRDLTERLVERHYVFDDADAFYDLYLHTVDRTESNPFSQICPTVMYKRGNSVFTLDYLCTRWGWSKCKVSRFFKKVSDYFSLVKLQSSYGCLIFNKVFQTDLKFTVPSQEDCFAIVNEMKSRSEYFGVYEELMYYSEHNFSENEYINCIINNLVSFIPEEEAKKTAQFMVNFETCRSKNNISDSKNEKSLPTFGNYYFDLKKCVLQFLTYNNTLSVIKEFYNNYSATEIMLLKSDRSSNFTFNSENPVCPIFRTMLQWARPYVYHICSPILASATQIAPITNSDANWLKFSYTAEAYNASPPQKCEVSKFEGFSMKSLRILLKSVFAKLNSKIKYFAKGVIKL